MMKNILLTGAGALLVSAGVSTAYAADIVEPGVYDWTGPFIGLQGGYAWGSNDTSSKNSENGPPPFSIGDRSGSLDLDGFVGGLHAGYNWQSDSLVLGVVGDIEYADLDDKTNIRPVGGFREFNDIEPTSDLKGELNWLGSLRLRAGFAADRALFYATGGLAVGGAKLSVDDPFLNEKTSESDTKWGWTLGAGIEYALTDELSALVEYRYTDLGSIDLSYDLPDGKRKAESDLDFHAIRAGLSWHFRGL